MTRRRSLGAWNAKNETGRIDCHSRQVAYLFDRELEIGSDFCFYVNFCIEWNQASESKIKFFAPSAIKFSFVQALLYTVGGILELCCHRELG